MTTSCPCTQNEPTCTICRYYFPPCAPLAFSVLPVCNSRRPGSAKQRDIRLLSLRRVRPVNHIPAICLFLKIKTGTKNYRSSA